MLSKPPAVICDYECLLGYNSHHIFVRNFLDTLVSDFRIILTSTSNFSKEQSQNLLGIINIYFDEFFAEDATNRKSKISLKEKILNEKILPSFLPKLVIEPNEECILLWKIKNIPCIYLPSTRSDLE